MRHRCPGFGLIELIVVLMVSAVLLTVALPAFSQAVQRQRATATVNQLNAAMAQARLLALSSRRPGLVCPSIDGSNCRTDGIWDDGWITFVDGNANRLRDGNEVVLRADSPAHTAVQVRSSAQRSRAVFLPNGTAGGSNLTLRICSDGQVRAALIVSNGGRARSASSRELGSMDGCGA